MGYSLAGKTGTAQIFDAVHHVYTHKYNASFLGFAPVNNPSFLMVVTVAGTTGQAGFGAYAAGPVFEAAAETALRIREVPRDVPEEIEAIEQKALLAQQKLNKQKTINVDAADPVAQLSTPLTEDELGEAAGDTSSTDGAQAQTVAAGPKVPDFVGKTIKDVMQEATAEGIDIDMQGDGLARVQFPLAGTPLLPGTHIHVRFER